MSSCRSTSTAVEYMYACELNSRLEIEKNSWTPLIRGSLALSKGTVTIFNDVNHCLSGPLLLLPVGEGFRVLGTQGPDMICYRAVHLLEIFPHMMSMMTCQHDDVSDISESNFRIDWCS
jgi:hypothetical protein